MAGEVTEGGYLSRERSCLKCVVRVSYGTRAILFNREIVRTATRAIIVFADANKKQRGVSRQPSALLP